MSNGAPPYGMVGGIQSFTGRSPPTVTSRAGVEAAAGDIVDDDASTDAAGVAAPPEEPPRGAHEPMIKDIEMTAMAATDRIGST